MGYWVDIAQGDASGRQAVGAHLQVQGGDLFVLLESGAPELGEAPLGAALGALLAAVACAPARSPFRALEMAMQAANRSVYDRALQNPTLRDLLVSCSAVLARDGELHVASAGANAVYLRVSGQTRELCEPETAQRKLIEEGVTSDSGSPDSTPVNGLGLAPELFSLRQIRTISEPDEYLLVMGGGRAAALLGRAHVEAFSPAGGDSRTASRLYRQVEPRLVAPSAVLAAHRAIDFEAVEPSPRQVVEASREGPAFQLPAWAWGLAVLALAGIVAYLVWPDSPSRPGREGKPPNPTLLLPAKPPGADTRELPAQIDVIAEPEWPNPDVATAVQSRLSTRDVAAETTDGGGTDVDGGRDMADGIGADADAEDEAARLERERKARERRERRARRRRERRERERRERERREREAPEARERTQKAGPGGGGEELYVPDVKARPAGDVKAPPREATPGEPDTVSAPAPVKDVVPGPATAVEEPGGVQVMDFTKPDPEEESGGTPAQPARKPFPAAKLDVPDLKSPGPVEPARTADPARPDAQASEL